MASSLMPGNEKAEGLVTFPSGVGEHTGLSLSHTHTHTPGCSLLEFIVHLVHWCKAQGHGV